VEQKSSKLGLLKCLEKVGWVRERSHGADSGVLAALCVSYILKTCKHILSCTEYFVCEKEAYNATQASQDGCLVGEG